MFETFIYRDVLEDIVDLSAVDYTKRHTTPSPEVVLISYIYIDKKKSPPSRNQISQSKSPSPR